MAASTIQIERKTPRLRAPHFITWSTLLRYLRAAPRMTKPMTTLTRASHPPLLGIRFKYEGNKAKRKNGSARPAAKVNMPAAGRARLPPTEAARRDPTNGPTHAKEASEKVSPITSVPTKPPFPEVWFRRVSTEEGIVIS